MGSGGAPPSSATPQQTKDPLVAKTDLLRLTALNNMAAVYSQMGRWRDAKEKCSRVLQHDERNTKALFRRGVAHRKLNLYELARADFEKARELCGNSKDAAIARQLKLLEKDEKQCANRKKRVRKARRKKSKNKKAKKA